MLLKIQNYGSWEGDKPGGHHPPGCTCVKCNQERRQLEASQEEERRAKEYDRRVAQGRAFSFTLLPDQLAASPPVESNLHLSLYT